MVPMVHRIPNDEEVYDPMESTSSTSNTNIVDHSRPVTGRKRRVRFDETHCRTTTAPTGATPLLDKTLTENDCTALWYTPDEIATMRAAAKECIKHHHNHRRKSSLSLDDPDQLAGLERFSSQRAAWKRSAIHYTLLAQKQQRQLHDLRQDPYKGGKAAGFIRKVSLRCTGWAREQAIRQGFKDYCAVHDPLASLFEGSEENYNDCFFSDHTPSEHDDRCKDNDGNDIDNDNDGQKRKRSTSDSTIPVTESSLDEGVGRNTEERNVKRRVSAKASEGGEA